jgi:hypothetical protein
MAWFERPSAITDSTSRARSVRSSNVLHADRRHRHHRKLAAEHLAVDEGDVDILLQLLDQRAPGPAGRARGIPPRRARSAR